MAFLISTFSLFYFPRYQGGPKLTLGGITPPGGEIFLPKASISQCLIVFLISTFLLQYFSGYQGGPKFTLRGPALPGGPQRKNFETRTSTCLYLYNCKFSASQLHSRGTNGALSLQLVCIEKSAKMGFLGDYWGMGQDIWWEPPQVCNDRRSTSFGEKIMEMVQIAQSVHSAKKLQKEMECLCREGYISPPCSAYPPLNPQLPRGACGVLWST